MLILYQIGLETYLIIIIISSYLDDSDHHMKLGFSQHYLELVDTGISTTSDTTKVRRIPNGEAFYVGEGLILKSS